MRHRQHQREEGVRGNLLCVQEIKGPEASLINATKGVVRFRSAAADDDDGGEYKIYKKFKNK